MSRKKLVVVAGPTAVGKTTVAIRLAREFGTAVISADSRQIFREMTIGTAKPTPEERQDIPHYFVDSRSVAEDYDAATYAEEALAVIDDLFRRHDALILCGGSGLYIRGVCDGFDDIPEVPGEVRTELMEQYEQHGLTWLQERMRQVDPEALKMMDEKNPHRLIRALEVKLYTGESIVSFRTNKKHERNFEAIKIGLTLPREELYARIDARMDDMIANGLFDEARALYPLRHQNALQTVGYQEIFDFMENKYDYDECVRLLKRNSRRYAKRQLTWFKKDTGFTWFTPYEMDSILHYLKSKI
ncbi:MAG TPA: tRNA (adenosine(37)-N6)-dimethylallyltransferase MiaA [Chryseosolibacter sp.]|nr:tRNA (adenosine(37)-N6)-dimethylallyltransferase MiaA [Chryseosolibacter sp.]